MQRLATVFLAALVAQAWAGSGSSSSGDGGKSGVTCVPYKPVGWNSYAAKIRFFDNNPSGDPANGPGFSAPTLPANASVGNPWRISNHNSSTGYAFHYQACNVSSLGLTTNKTQSSCSDGGCYISYFNYVRVVNPATGHCLSADSTNASVSELGFRTCNAHPADFAQFYETSQQVLYSPGFGHITSYGFVELDPVEMRSPFVDWYIDRRDNVTLQLIENQYTQDGLSAYLVKA